MNWPGSRCVDPVILVIGIMIWLLPSIPKSSHMGQEPLGLTRSESALRSGSFAQCCKLNPQFVDHVYNLKIVACSAGYILAVSQSGQSPNYSPLPLSTLIISTPRIFLAVK